MTVTMVSWAGGGSSEGRGIFIRIRLPSLDRVVQQPARSKSSFSRRLLRKW